MYHLVACGSSEVYSSLLLLKYQAGASSFLFGRVPCSSLEVFIAALNHEDPSNQTKMGEYSKHFSGLAIFPLRHEELIGLLAFSLFRYRVLASPEGSARALCMRSIQPVHIVANNPTITAWIKRVWQEQAKLISLRLPSLRFIGCMKHNLWYVLPTLTLSIIQVIDYIFRDCWVWTIWWSAHDWGIVMDMVWWYGLWWLARSVYPPALWSSVIVM